VQIRVDEVRDYLSDRIRHEVLGSAEVVVGTCALTPGAPGHLSFASRHGEAARAAVSTTAASVLLVLEEHATAVPAGVVALVVDDPRLEYARVAARFLTVRPPPGVHPTAVIHPDAVVGEDAVVGPCAVVEAGVRIGDRATLGAHVVLGAGTVLGDDVTIGPGTVIGYTGFGYAREADGTPVLIPHQGGVVIGDRVEIGANTAIDRGTIDDTVVCDDAKIDNLVHIAHNCHIGRGAFVIATAILCGGVRVGAGAWIAPNVAVREQLSIGENAIVGLSATVTKSVEPGVTVVGSPARPVGPRS
jgi:UDP-3-O-[3-hydroxymyristoyl] glucosamine N-acyltransferase